MPVIQKIANVLGLSVVAVGLTVPALAQEAVDKVIAKVNGY